MADSASTHWLTRFLFFRLLGLVYVVAFLIVLRQWEPLLGSHGLLPAHEMFERVRESIGGGPLAFLRLPTLFWLSDSDAAFRLFGWVGLAGSLVLLAGFANVPLLGRALVPLHVVRARRRPLLRLRLGDPAARGGLPRDLPGAARAPASLRARQRPAVAARDHAAALADVPADARRRAHQAARRSVLARPHLPRLPLRDAAEPEPALLVPAPAAGLVPQARGPLQPRRRARGPLVLLRAAPRAARGRCAHGALPGASDRERQPLVPELADDRRGRLVLRRRPACSGSCRTLCASGSRAAWPAWRSASRGPSSAMRSRS